MRRQRLKNPKKTITLTKKKIKRDKRDENMEKCSRKQKTEIPKNTVQGIETMLSIVSSKTTDLEKFKEYCKLKNVANKIIGSYYEKPIHRKLKLNRYINTQKSETKMIKNFIKKFGRKENLLVVLGDYDKNENMKRKEPAITKKIRYIFKRNNFDIYLINEFRTSKLCNVCQCVCKNVTKKMVVNKGKKLRKFKINAATKEKDKVNAINGYRFIVKKLKNPSPNEKLVNTTINQSTNASQTNNTENSVINQTENRKTIKICNKSIWGLCVVGTTLSVISSMLGTHDPESRTLLNADKNKNHYMFAIWADFGTMMSI